MWHENMIRIQVFCKRDICGDFYEEEKYKGDSNSALIPAIYLMALKKSKCLKVVKGHSHLTGGED